MNDEIYAQVLGRMLRNWRLSQGMNLFKVAQETDNRLESIRNVECGQGKLTTLASYCHYVALTDKYHYHAIMDEWGEKMTTLEGMTRRATEAITQWCQDVDEQKPITEDLHWKISLMLSWMELVDAEVREREVAYGNEEMKQLLKTDLSVMNTSDYTTEELIFDRYTALRELVSREIPAYSPSKQLQRALFTISMEPELRVANKEFLKFEQEEQHAVEEVHWNARHPENHKWDAIKAYHKQCRQRIKGFEKEHFNVRILKQCSKLQLLNEQELFEAFLLINQNIK
jgi:hypothetical protein